MLFAASRLSAYAVCRLIRDGHKRHKIKYLSMIDVAGDAQITHVPGAVLISERFAHGRCGKRNMMSVEGLVGEHP